MAIQGSRPQNRIILVIGVVLALVAGALAFVAVTKGVGTSGGQTQDVYVALQPITAGEPLSQSLFTKQAVNIDALPADPVSDITQVDNKTAPYPLSRGAILTQTFLTAQATGPNGPTGLLPVSAGDVALAVGVKGQTVDTSVELVTVGYYIRPGDHIDILIDIAGPGPNDHTIRYGFQDVRVLAVGGQTTATTSASSSSGGSAAAAPAVTLSAPTYLVVELPRNQAELLTLMLAGKACDGPCQPGGANNTAVNAVTIAKYVLRPSAEYGKPDDKGNYLAPVYEPGTGTPVPGKPDPGGSSASVASAFPKP